MEIAKPTTQSNTQGVADTSSQKDSIEHHEYCPVRRAGPARAPERFSRAEQPTTSATTQDHVAR
eukprot:12105171-Alexandrium_andersonii.AAC.1